MQEGYILEGLRKPLVSIGSRMQDEGGMENVSEGFRRVINAMLGKLLVRSICSIFILIKRISEMLCLTDFSTHC